MQLDRLHYAIIGQLARDATRKRQEIALELDISQGSLSKRIASLVAHKIIKRFTVELDLGKLGLNTHAISLIKLEHQSEEKLREIEDRLKTISSATEYASMLGDYDFFVRWMCRDNDHLVSEVRHLLEIPGVHVETHSFGGRSYRAANIFSAIIE